MDKRKNKDCFVLNKKFAYGGKAALNKCLWNK